MIINNNMMAMNTHRQLGVLSGTQTKSMERLSSGLRINRAGDDATGLAISEKMRSQIRGLEQASRNGQDGISLIQTAEGALSETQAILQRMRELAVQSATDTNTSQDRGEIQKEIDELAKEMTRITNSTEFNTQKLLNGGMTSATSGITNDLKFHIGANAAQSFSMSIGALDAYSLGVSRDLVGSATGTSSAANIASATFTGDFGAGIVDGAVLSFDYTAAVNAVSAVAAEWDTGAVTAVANTGSGTFIFNGVTVTVNTGAVAGASVTGAKAVSIGIANDEGAAGTANAILTAIAAYKADAVTADGSLDDFTFGGDATGITIVDTLANGATNNALTYTGTITTAGDGTTSVDGVTAVAAELATVEITSGVGHVQTVTVDGSATSLAFSSGNFKGMTLNLQTNIATDLDGAATVTIAATSDVSAAASFSNGSLISEATTAAGINVSTQAAASSAITTITSAIEQVSAERSKLGAAQSRLEHTIKNLNASAENLQAAESRIRDVDMAKEIMMLTKTSILQQAAQAMLAQANQAPQGVLQLLR